MAKKIQVDEIIEGMVLKSPVVNQYGQVLLGANTELKENHRRMLKMWGIAYVSIESEDEPEELSFSEEILDLAL